MTNFSRSGYIPLDRAVEAIDRRIMPREWLGQEVILIRALFAGEEAQRKFGSRLPDRSFERIWAATMPAAWRQPVRTRLARRTQ